MTEQNIGFLLKLFLMQHEGKRFCDVVKESKLESEIKQVKILYGYYVLSDETSIIMWYFYVGDLFKVKVDNNKTCLINIFDYISFEDQV